VSSCNVAGESCLARPYFDLGFLKTKKSNIASAITTKEDPMPIPTFVPVDSPEAVAPDAVPDDVVCTAEPVDVNVEGLVVDGVGFDDVDMIVDNAATSVPCQLICINGAYIVKTVAVLPIVTGAWRYVKPALVPDSQVKTSRLVEDATN
jgi:hypothetical protein